MIWGGILVTKAQILETYLRWVGSCETSQITGLLNHPIADFDVFEDEHRLVNRLYYAIPSFAENHFHCFIFFEENTFLKNALGDCILIHSEYQVEKPDLPDIQRLYFTVTRYG